MIDRIAVTRDLDGIVAAKRKARMLRNRSYELFNIWSPETARRYSFLLSSARHLEGFAEAIEQRLALECAAMQS